MLLGREVERVRLEDLADAVAAGGSAVLRLVGDPGVGKTALLGHATGAAEERGLRVVRMAGVGSESALPFAGVQRLLLALRVPVATLPAPQREALDLAFGLVAGPPPDRFRIGAAVRAAFEAAAADGPLLCCVDDLQWIDADSRDVLAFTARRLHEGGLGLLLAERTAEPGPVDGPFDDLPCLPVGGLPHAAAIDLLDRVLGRPVDPPIADRIVTATGGNPLALVELAPSLSGHQLVGGTLLPEPLPIGPTLERHYLGRVGALPPDTRTWLLVAATAGSGEPGLVGAAAAVLGLAADAAEPAEEAGLMWLGARAEFRHPLVAAAVYSGAPAGDRRRAHRAVAHAFGTGTIGHAWHLAAATVGRDEQVAAALEEAGRRAAGRGGHAARARFLQRAAELTPEGPRRTDRLLDAAESLTAAGYPVRAGEIVEALPVEELTGARRGRALLARAEVRLVSGVADRVRAAPAVCLAAADAFAEVDPDGEVAALLRAVELLLTVEHEVLGTTTAELAARALRSTPAGPELPGLLLRAMATLALRPYPEAVGALRRAGGALLAAGPGAALRHVVIGVAVTTALFDDAARDRLLRRAAEEARRVGALQVLHSVLWMHSQTAAALGLPRTANALLDESRAAGRAIGLSPVVEAVHTNVTCRAWEGAGGSADLRAELAAAGAFARGIGMIGMGTIADHARVVLDLADGRVTAAHEVATGIREARFLQVGNLVLGDLAEAAALAGRSAEAAAAAADLEAIAEASGTDLARGLAARARALVAARERGTAPDAVEAAFRESARRLQRSLAAGELARTRLLYGEWLRRGRRRRDARAELRAAAEAFDALGAAGFAARARRELRATGEHAAHGPLTPQEASVAALAACGATNVEIAARLTLSRHTVDYHLRKVFRKLAVADRRQLAARLGPPEGAAHGTTDGTTAWTTHPT